MTTLDWIAVAVIAVAAVFGLRRGLVTSVLSALGIVGGAIVGARVAPHLLSRGASSPYTPLIALFGAAIGAAGFETLGSLAGRAVRGSLRLTPLRALDSFGGLVVGAVGGVVVIWMIGAVGLLVPGATRLRGAVARSEIVRRLDEAVPPRRVLNALARIDPLPAITGPAAPARPPDPSVLRNAAARRAARSVVKVLGTACGVGIEGSGWFVRPNVVVTNAHVVAGEGDTVVQRAGSGETFRAHAILFDTRNDVALLRVDGLRARPLALRDPQPGAPVVILGYPENGPLTARPGRVGETASAFSQNASGRPVTREITSLSGEIRHGNSGGPAVDRDGAVEATVFAARVGASGGFGIPSSVVRELVSRPHRPVSTGPCAA